ncbi:MAG: hypothetical protein BWY32_02906 [bacterium ADurb.Bin243]|nr:MAG: hypothetical protein BWY32_02906 [bacterium ADurb.Bin243]
MSDLNPASSASMASDRAHEIKKAEVTVNCRLLNRSYNNQMLEMIAANNPGVCRYENGALTMDGLAYVLFSEGLEGAKRKFENIKAGEEQICKGK